MEPALSDGRLENCSENYKSQDLHLFLHMVVFTALNVLFKASLEGCRVHVLIIPAVLDPLGGQTQLPATPAASNQPVKHQP